MAIPLFFIAAILFIAAYRGQLGYLASNLEQDLKGFMAWMVAIIAIGAIGLIPKMRPVSNALFFLVFLVLILANSKKGQPGIFQNIINGSAFKPVSPPAGVTTMGETSTPPPASPGVSTSGSATADKGGTPVAGGGSTGIMNNIIPFPNLAGQGSPNLFPGLTLPGGSSTPPAPAAVMPGGGGGGVLPNNQSGVTIEDIQITPGPGV